MTLVTQLRDILVSIMSWQSLLFTLLAVTMSTALALMPKLESTCETMTNKLHITKEEFNKAKELMRTCEEDIELVKCEGSCVSSTMPSAMDR